MLKSNMEERPWVPLRKGDNILLVTFPDQDKYAQEALIQALKKRAPRRWNSSPMMNWPGRESEKTSVEDGWKESDRMESAPWNVARSKYPFTCPEKGSMIIWSNILSLQRSCSGWGDANTRSSTSVTRGTNSRTITYSATGRNSFRDRGFSRRSLRSRWREGSSTPSQRLPRSGSRTLKVRTWSTR